MAKGRIPESDIQEIRDRTPIEDVVGEYVQLTSAGSDSLKGLSPFKDEKTPSFHVRPNHGYFHCFSTGKGGDVFTFLMEMEHVTFPEAVEMCADRIGYQIHYQGGKPGRREEAGTRQRLIAANKAAHEFYRRQLETPQAQVGRTFLLDRGFTKDQIHDFEIGYAPDGWDTLTKHLLSQGFTVKELQDAGLSSMGKRGPIDKFRRRLIWPIKSLAGDVIGFGARKLFEDDNLGKYMNTQETMLYHKSRVLFGLDKAKRSIAEGHQAVVVEGYTDVMAMHAAGVRTAVAACGTAFGEEHLQQLRRLMLDDSFFRGELIYTFDGDEAGRKAAMRAFSGEQNFIGQSFVAVAPDNMDPCELRQHRGDAAVRDLVASRIPIVEFVLRGVLEDYSLSSPEERLQGLRRTVPIVASIRDRVLRREYARRLAGWLGWDDVNEVVRQVEQEAKAPKKSSTRKFVDVKAAPVSHAPTLKLPNPRDPTLWPERESLKLALQYPELVGSYFDGLPKDSFNNNAYRVVRTAIANAGGCSSGLTGVDWLAAVNDRMTDLIGKSLVSELAVEDVQVREEDLPAYVDSVLSRLQTVRVSNEIAHLKGQLSRMRTTDPNYNEVFEDLLALEQAKRELSARVFKS